MAKRITAKEFYETVKREMDILRLAAYGTGVTMIDITLSDNGGFRLDLYREEDGKQTVDTLDQFSFKTQLEETGKRVIA